MTTAQEGGSLPLSLFLSAPLHESSTQGSALSARTPHIGRKSTNRVDKCWDGSEADWGEFSRGPLSPLLRTLIPPSLLPVDLGFWYLMGMSPQLPQSTWLAPQFLPPSKLRPHCLPPSTFHPHISCPAPSALLPLPCLQLLTGPLLSALPASTAQDPGGTSKKGLPTPLNYLQNRPTPSSGRGFLTAHLQAPSSQETSPPALYPPASRGQNHCPKLSRSPEPMTSSGSAAEGNKVAEWLSMRQREFPLQPGRQCNERA